MSIDCGGCGDRLDENDLPLYGIYSAESSAIIGSARYELWDGGEAEVTVATGQSDFAEWMAKFPDAVSVGRLRECIRFAADPPPIQ
jgi:hypothetical protein